MPAQPLEEAQVMGMCRAAHAAVKDARRWLRLIAEKNKRHEPLLTDARSMVAELTTELAAVEKQLTQQHRERAHETSTKHDD